MPSMASFSGPGPLTSVILVYHELKRRPQAI
jgi:hypothetical protein